MSPRNFYGFALFIAVAALMISSESLWIDEAQTYRFAAQPSFGAWVETLKNDTFSEAQMPFSMLIAWLSAQFLGTSEWAMRAANILWIGLGGIAISRLASMLHLRWLVPVYLVHPFVWYYANEARPYALIICLGAWLLLLLLQIQNAPDLKPRLFWLAGLLSLSAFGTSLLCAFFLMGLGLTASLFCLRRRSELTKRHLPPLVITIAGLSVLSIYYLWTLKKGATGAKIWRLGPASVGFAGYEFLGFGGLGLPRQELRELGRNIAGNMRQIFQPQYLVGLIGLGGVYVALASQAQRLAKDPAARTCVLVSCITCCSLVTAAALAQFPFWGRHFSYLLPAFLVLVGLTIKSVESAFGKRASDTIAGLLLICFTISSLQLRFNPRHRKDDYRSATSVAKDALAAGKSVWWSADQSTAGYYKLHFDPEEKSGTLRLMSNRSPNDKCFDSESPDVIITSKPDVYDYEGAVSRFTLSRNYEPDSQIKAFTIWMKR